MYKVSVNAARLRFRRHCARKNIYRYICRLKRRESARYYDGARFVLMDGNIVRDWGNLEALERWCRQSGVLDQTEYLEG